MGKRIFTDKNGVVRQSISANPPHSVVEAFRHALQDRGMKLQDAMEDALQRWTGVPQESNGTTITKADTMHPESIKYNLQVVSQKSKKVQGLIGEIVNELQKIGDHAGGTQSQGHRESSRNKQKSIADTLGPVIGRADKGPSSKTGSDGNGK